MYYKGFFLILRKIITCERQSSTLKEIGLNILQFVYTVAIWFDCNHSYKFKTVLDENLITSFVTHSLTVTKKLIRKVNKLNFQECHNNGLLAYVQPCGR